MVLTLTKNPEVWIVESFQTGLYDVYDNLQAAQDCVNEMNKECPDDHYWFYPRPLKSK
jgi:hypothetical protein